ncbi:hypothetical protein BT69DRAFT_268084, partial [Atractiella rhizophila]
MQGSTRLLPHPNALLRMGLRNVLIARLSPLQYVCFTTQVLTRNSGPTLAHMQLICTIAFLPNRSMVVLLWRSPQVASLRLITVAFSVAQLMRRYYISLESSQVVPTKVYIWAPTFNTSLTLFSFLSCSVFCVPVMFYSVKITLQDGYLATLCFPQILFLTSISLIHFRNLFRKSPPSLIRLPRLQRTYRHRLFSYPLQVVLVWWEQFYTIDGWLVCSWGWLLGRGVQCMMVDVRPTQTMSSSSPVHVRHADTSSLVAPVPVHTSRNG